MINVKDSKVQEVLEIIHEAIIRKEKRGGRLNEEILTEGKIFSVICKDFDMGPRKIVDCMEESYGYDITVDEVIKLLRGAKMGIPGERKEFLAIKKHLKNLTKFARNRQLMEKKGVFKNV